MAVSCRQKTCQCCYLTIDFISVGDADAVLSSTIHLVTIGDLELLVRKSSRLFTKKETSSSFGTPFVGTCVLWNTSDIDNVAGNQLLHTLSPSIAPRIHSITFGRPPTSFSSTPFLLCVPFKILEEGAAPSSQVCFHAGPVSFLPNGAVFFLESRHTD